MISIVKLVFVLLLTCCAPQKEIPRGEVRIAQRDEETSIYVWKSANSTASFTIERAQLNPKHCALLSRSWHILAWGINQDKMARICEISDVTDAEIEFSIHATEDRYTEQGFLLPITADLEQLQKVGSYESGYMDKMLLDPEYMNDMVFSLRADKLMSKAFLEGKSAMSNKVFLTVEWTREDALVLSQYLRKHYQQYVDRVLFTLVIGPDLRITVSELNAIRNWLIFGNLYATCRSMKELCNKDVDFTTRILLHVLALRGMHNKP